MNAGAAGSETSRKTAKYDVERFVDMCDDKLEINRADTRCARARDGAAHNRAADADADVVRRRERHGLADERAAHERPQSIAWAAQHDKHGASSDPR